MLATSKSYLRQLISFRLYLHYTVGLKKTFPIWFCFVSFNFRLLVKYRSLSVAVPFVSFPSVPFCGRFPNLFTLLFAGKRALDCGIFLRGFVAPLRAGLLHHRHCFWACFARDLHARANGTERQVTTKRKQNGK